MGKKSESRLIMEIETANSTAILSLEEKQKIIIENVGLMRKYKYNQSKWWIRSVLPFILMRNNISKNLKVKL